MFGKKKKDGSVDMRLSKEEFCKVYKENAKEVTTSFCFITYENQYNLLYRDGKFLGMPTSLGGKLYPFSLDPTREGTKSQKKEYELAQVVCLSAQFSIKVPWGTRTPFLMLDPATQQAYSVGAKGMFYVKINPKDAARSADLFYKSCVAQMDGEYTNENLRDHLKEAFSSRIGAKVQEGLEQLGRPLSNLVGLQPSEMLEISESLFPKLRDMFNDYGLVMEDASSGSILDGLVVTPKQ